jgi:GH15 family glucan-1,4-alpha-glucosidase
MPGYRPIKDYGIIGDCRSLALVSTEGSIDWLCWPRFDSPALFSALLDADKGGRFSIRPIGPFTVERSYVRNTNVLRTRFTTEKGVLELVDLMPIASDEDRNIHLEPEHEIIRVVECPEGKVEFELLVDPGFEFGRAKIKPAHVRPFGFQFEYGPDLYTVRSEIPLRRSQSGTSIEGRVILNSGGRCRFSLSSAHGAPAVIPALGQALDEKIRDTIRWWEDWVDRCRYKGPFSETVWRSALVLKLLIYAPSGAMIAAGTTSLPEVMGGDANWDYRFCWLRDSAMTLRALFGLGYMTEGEAFLSWLIHATRLTQPELQVVYNVYGETHIAEKTLDHMEGYARSRPVRIGNEARSQLQLDIYGEVARGVYEFVKYGGRVDKAMSRVLVGLGKTVVDRWREPDHGIWEIRGEPRQHTFSKVMCWLALDQLLRLHEGGHIEAHVATFLKTRDEIRAAIESRGYNRDLKSYVSVFGSGIVDASLLLAALYGYIDPNDDCMRSTYDRIIRQLSHNRLLCRYREDFSALWSSGEGAFCICCFWAVSYLARRGDIREALDLYRHILGFSNDLGLFAEEIDPDTGDALGNFPQAFTHVGLIDAALTIDEEMRKRGLVQAEFFENDNVKIFIKIEGANMKPRASG